MAFMNEYASQEDVEKYQLDKKFLKRHPEYKVIPEDFHPAFTIDRKKTLI